MGVALAVGLSNEFAVEQAVRHGVFAFPGMADEAAAVCIVGVVARTSDGCRHAAVVNRRAATATA